MTASLFPSLSHRARSAHVALALALAVPAGLTVASAQAPAQQPPSLSEKVSTEFQKLKPLQFLLA